LVLHEVSTIVPVQDSANIAEVIRVAIANSFFMVIHTPSESILQTANPLKGVSYADLLMCWC